MARSSAATPTSCACPGRAVCQRARRRSRCAGNATTRRAGWPPATVEESSGSRSRPATADGTGRPRRGSTSTSEDTTARWVFLGKRLSGHSCFIKYCVSGEGQAKKHCESYDLNYKIKWWSYFVFVTQSPPPQLAHWGYSLYHWRDPMSRSPTHHLYECTRRCNGCWHK